MNITSGLKSQDFRARPAFSGNLILAISQRAQPAIRSKAIIGSLRKKLETGSGENVIKAMPLKDPQSSEGKGRRTRGRRKRSQRGG